jgi:hypothetical protein
MKLTREIIHGAGTLGMGFNRHQLGLLGVKWPPKKGWLSGLIGTEIPDETWEKVMRLKSVRRKAERLRALQDENYNPRLL